MGEKDRQPRVHNDRAAEVGRALNANDFDLDRIFGDEGARILHLSDRIGGGDGFVGGMLYGIPRGRQPEQCLRFGWATGALPPRC